MAGLLRLSQGHIPIVFYDRPAIQAEARTFFFFFCLSAQHPQSDRVYPRCAILQQGMHLNVFSKVYCDRVYFSCAERIMTGSGFDPPAAPPYPVEKSECPPVRGGGGGAALILVIPQCNNYDFQTYFTYGFVGLVKVFPDSVHQFLS